MEKEPLLKLDQSERDGSNGIDKIVQQRSSIIEKFGLDGYYKKIIASLATYALTQSDVAEEIMWKLKMFKNDLENDGVNEEKVERLEEYCREILMKDQI